MKIILITTFSLLLLIGVSCDEAVRVNESSPQEVTRYRRVNAECKDSPICNKGNSVDSNGLLPFLGLPVDKDLFSTFLYGLILLCSCLYCRQTGKQRTTLEENLLLLARRVNWRQRLALFLFGWIRRNRNMSSKTRRNKRK